MTADPLAVALAATLTELGPEADAWARDLRQALAAQGVYLVTAESLAAAHHEGCCSDSIFRLVKWRYLPADSCREYHEQMARRTLAAIKEPQP